MICPAPPRESRSSGTRRCATAVRIGEIAEDVCVELPAVRIDQRSKAAAAATSDSQRSVRCEQHRSPQSPPRGRSWHGHSPRAAVDNRSATTRQLSARFRAQHGPQQEEPAEDVRPRQPVDIAGGEQQRRHRAGDQEVAAQRPVQPEPQPDAGGDRDARRTSRHRGVPRRDGSRPTATSRPIPRRTRAGRRG